MFFKSFFNETISFLSCLISIFDISILFFSVCFSRLRISFSFSIDFVCSCKTESSSKLFLIVIAFFRSFSALLSFSFFNLFASVSSALIFASKSAIFKFLSSKWEFKVSTSSASSIALAFFSAFSLCNVSTSFSYFWSFFFNLSISFAFGSPCLLLGLEDLDRACSALIWTFIFNPSTSLVAFKSSVLSCLIFETESLDSRFWVSIIAFKNWMFCPFPSRFASTVTNFSFQFSFSIVKSSISCFKFLISFLNNLSSDSKYCELNTLLRGLLLLSFVSSWAWFSRWRLFP